MTKAIPRGYIDPVKNKKGMTYKAKVRVRDKDRPTGYYDKNRTWDTRKQAQNWIDEIIKRLKREGVPTLEEEIEKKEALKNSRLKEVRFGELILNYIEDPQNSRDIIGDSKYYGLIKIASYKIANKRVSTLRKSDLDEFLHQRRYIDKVKPYTAYMDIGYIKSVIKEANDYGINGSISFIEDAMILYKEEYRKSPKKSLIEFKARARDTTISKKDFDLLRAGLLKRQEHHAAKIPYLTILDFAVATCMRVSEICRVTWKDFKDDRSALIIRDRKHPTKKNFDQEIPLIGGAFEILQKRKAEIIKTGTFNYDKRIFPYKADSVGAGWRVTRQKLIDGDGTKKGVNLEHIVFHDLRSHGITTLIKDGWDISEVAKVSGHTNLDVLNRIYNRITTEDIVKKYRKKEKEKEEEEEKEKKQQQQNKGKK
jgi:integrase